MKFSLGRQSAAPPVDGLSDVIVLPDPVAAPKFIDTEPPPRPVVVAAPTVPIDEAQSCSGCGEAFGRRAVCRSCGAPRRQCAICGTRIFKGAMTCREHSGLAPDPVSLTH